MTLSVLVAKIIAIIYLSVAAGLIFSRDYYKKELIKIIENSGAMYVGAFIAIVFGFLIIQYHNIWESNWTVLITIIGWLSLIKGILIMAFPKLLNMVKPLYKNGNPTILMVICLILGAVFGYFGFIG